MIPLRVPTLVVNSFPDVSESRALAEGSFPKYQIPFPSHVAIQEKFSWSNRTPPFVLLTNLTGKLLIGR